MTFLTGARIVSKNRRDSTPMLNTKQIYAVDLLSRSVNKKEVAAQVGVNRGTIYNWLADAEFRQEVQDRRESLRHLLNDPTPYLTGLSYWRTNLPEVMRAVLEVARDSSHKNHLRAAEMILSYFSFEAPQEHETKDSRMVAEFARTHGWDLHGTG